MSRVDELTCRGAGATPHTEADRMRSVVEAALRWNEADRAVVAAGDRPSRPLRRELREAADALAEACDAYQGSSDRREHRSRPFLSRGEADRAHRILEPSDGATVRVDEVAAVDP